MNHNMKPMACGACGCGTFTAHTANKHECIELECTQCKSSSKIVASKPRIEVMWGEGASGVITVMAPKS